MQHDDRASDTNERYRTLSRYVFFGFVAVAAYFLIAEHRAHVLPFLPFLLLAACPLLHVFHHRGHDHEGEDSRPSSKPPSSSSGGAHQH